MDVRLLCGATFLRSNRYYGEAHCDVRLGTKWR